MVALEYKTRGGSNPQGKQKVYFTCYPMDFEKYFDKVSGQILEYENCAIWYSRFGAEYQDIELDLGQMNLFVIPVTTKLLTMSNRTVDIDLPFALKHHIPVLPLMQENGLDDLFNRKFGDLQYLYEGAQNGTAIPYKERLKQYLSSVLVGDKLAVQIRAAFDAYIFLSYRKKDIKYALELMCLIHKRDFCRDIAIWYDEFLTPGEAFNSAIKNALKKSDLFALVVTPNLVNEDNYVQNTEYPLARNFGKKILPAELVDTDKGLLAQMYESIPKCVDARNDTKLSQALLGALDKYVKQRNDGDSQHNFFIGLAYLNGVDVEIDNVRAVSLITSAARAGLQEATKKLVSMYQKGEGVARDYWMAIEWQRTLVEQCKIAYLHSGWEKDCLNLVHAYLNLGDYLYGVHNLPGAEAAFLAVERLSKELNEKNENIFFRTLLASYERLGNIREVQGNPTDAEAYYTKCLMLSKALAEATEIPEVRRDLLVIYGKLGNIFKDQGDSTSAEAYYAKALALSKQLVAESGTIEARSDLSACYNNLGNIREVEGNLAGAEAYYTKALALREKLLTETKTVKARRDLSASYDNLGDICKVQGDLADAEAYYIKGLALSEQLAAEIGTVEAWRDLSVSYDNLGDICKAQGDLADAEAYYIKGLALSEQLAAEIGTVEARRDLSVSYCNLGDIRQAQGDFANAEAYYIKGLALSEQLAKETRSVVNYDTLAILYFKCAMVKEVPNIDLLQKVLKIYDTLVQQCPDVVLFRQKCDAIQNFLAQIS